MKTAKTLEPRPWFDPLVQSLGQQFAQARKRNFRFSHSSFARKAKISRPAMSLLLAGKANWLTASRALKIIDNLDFPEFERNRLRLLIGAPLSIQRKNPGSLALKMLTDWTYYPIFFSFELPAVFNSLSALAKRLGLSEVKVRMVIKDLCQHKLLKTSKDGTLVPVLEHWKLGDGPPSEVVRKHHHDNLTLAAMALEQIAPEERDFSSVTFTARKDQLPQIQAEIRAFYDRLLVLMNDEKSVADKDEIFRVMVSAFPFQFSKEEK